MSHPPKWEYVVAGKTLMAKRLALKFVPPLLKEGKKIIKLDHAEVDKLSES